jgi:uncharacterized protein (DUF1501 family)
VSATDSGSKSSLAQTPLNAPTVFNFWYPDYKYPGPLASAGMTTPEFQLTSDTTVAQQMNFLAGGLLNNAIAGTASPTYWTSPFPTQITAPTGGTPFSSTLSPQLQMIARLIEAGRRSVASGGFGMKRQIFFCQVGGYDLHGNQTPGPDQATVGAHANLLAELSQCMLAFQRAMQQLGVANNVTAFTASDFGRTLPCNGKGSDHGWGSHHLIFGGAVRGGRTYGRFPVLAVNGPDDTSTGRFIPTAAIDQYFATLAAWFGVDSGNLPLVFPNLSRFPAANLGFV